MLTPPVKTPMAKKQPSLVSAGSVAPQATSAASTVRDVGTRPRIRRGCRWMTANMHPVTAPTRNQTGFVDGKRRQADLRNHGNQAGPGEKQKKRRREQSRERCPMRAPATAPRVPSRFRRRRSRSLPIRSSFCPFSTLPARNARAVQRAMRGRSTTLPRLEETGESVKSRLVDPWQESPADSR